MLWQPKGLLQPNQSWHRPTETGVTLYSAEVSQYFDRLLTPPMSTRAALYVSLIDGLVSAGVWSKLDALFVFAAADSGTSLINLKSGSFQATLNATTGTPAFTVDRGWNNCLGPVVQSVNLNFNPSTAGGNYTRDDAMLCGWSIGTTSENKAIVSGVLGNGNVEIWPFGATTYVSVNTGGAEMAVTTPTPRDGFWLAQRTASNAQAAYNNTVSLASNSTASAALVNETLVCDQTANITATAALGASLSTGQHSSLYGGLQTYLHAVGAV